MQASGGCTCALRGLRAGPVAKLVRMKCKHGELVRMECERGACKDGLRA